MICPIFTATSPVWIRRMNKENRQELRRATIAGDQFASARGWVAS